MFASLAKMTSFSFIFISFKKIYTFIQQGCINLIKSGNLTKDLYTKILSSTNLFNIDDNNKCFLSSKLAY